MENKQEKLMAVTDSLEQKILSAEKLNWEDIQYALSHTEAEKDGGLYGLACYYAAFYMISNGRPDECMYYLNEGIRDMLGTSWEKELCRCYNMLGVVAHSQNNLVLAMEHYEKALTYARQYNNQIIYSLVAGNMADAYHRVGAYERAVTCYRECIRELERTGERTSNGENLFRKVLAGYGYSLIMAQRPKEADDVAKSLEKLMEDNAGNAPVKLAVYGFLAFFTHDRGDREGADRYTGLAVQAVTDGCTISADFDNILNLIQYLIQVEKFGDLQRILDCMEPQAAIEQNEGFLLQLLLYRLRYCSNDMDQESFLKSTQTFFRLKDVYEHAENNQVLRMMKLRNRLREIEEEQTRLIKENSKLLYQTEHDELSGLYNKRCLNRYMEEVFEEALHKGLPLGVLFVDIDYFKQMNDKYGHYKGDDCIMAISDAIKTCMPEDFAARYGGDEFVIITLGRSREYLQEHAQMLVDNVKARKIPNVDSRYMQIVTITIGAVHAVPHKPNKMWDFLSAADETLYLQKNEQKGCVRFYAGQGDGL